MSRGSETVRCSGAARRTPEALDQRGERLPEAVGVAQDHRLRLQAEIVERQHFDQLVQRSEPAGDRTKQVGTLNELIEMLTLNDLGLQAKPVILCDTDGFWEPFTALIERFPGVRRAAPEHRTVSEPRDIGRRDDALIDALLPAAQSAESRGV